MADSPTSTTTKHSPTKTNTVRDHKKSSLSSSPPPFGTQRFMAIAYAFTFAFVACTIFFFFTTPSTSSSSIWFTNIFKNKSQFTTIFSHLFPTNTSSHNSSISRSQISPSQFSQENHGFSGKIPTPSEGSSNSSSEAHYENPSSETKAIGDSIKFHGNESSPSRVPNASIKGDVDKHLVLNSSLQNVNNDSLKGVIEKNTTMNHTVLLKKESNLTSGSLMVTQRTETWLDMLSDCNIFNGKWVKDDSYPLYKPGSCPHIDEPFNCFLNGRGDNGYEKFRWQPNGCRIPRLNGKDMLELLRGKRLVYVGDSLNRNMWESMVCILRNSVEDKSKVFEASGRREFRTEGSYSFIFKDYNCSVEFFRSPFLVQEWEMPDTNGSKKETLRLDMVERSSDRYKSADILVFNTGHWWTHEKTSRGKGYYQEGSHIYGELNVVEAFRKALTTWARWIDANINPVKTLVFFRGYSVSHFRGGRWNSGGQCDSETEPIKNETYLAKYPPKMRTLERVMKGMQTPVLYLNITRMTDYRKDAHPSIYRKQKLTEEERRSPLRFQDCSHWCLPGLPDTWNELLYAQLIKHTQKQQKKQPHQEQQQQRP
ncbi:protein trichome birefringence-like 1 [Cornus florida]|uniref:protein trichome birefringence-like 1 n=1 Tax=Cornus florida TaxID=4283 RepID=UPI002898E403|nr:protein trichome birefringence-like 1 [Cornus florida]